jgi:hypothetical protein
VDKAEQNLSRTFTTTTHTTGDNAMTQITLHVITVSADILIHRTVHEAASSRVTVAQKTTHVDTETQQKLTDVSEVLTVTGFSILWNNTYGYV